MLLIRDVQTLILNNLPSLEVFTTGDESEEYDEVVDKMCYQNHLDEENVNFSPHFPHYRTIKRS